MGTPYEGHGITSYPHFTHVSPTTLRVLMHINLMPICVYIYIYIYLPNQSSIYHTKPMLNTSTYNPNISYTIPIASWLESS